jgi:hypothetical protein
MLLSPNIPPIKVKAPDNQGLLEVGGGYEPQ